MKIEAIKTPTTEVFLEAKDVTITVTQWANHEGVNLMMNGKDLSVRFAASLRWEEADMLLAALATARA